MDGRDSWLVNWVLGKREEVVVLEKFDRVILVVVVAVAVVPVVV